MTLALITDHAAQGVLLPIWDLRQPKILALLTTYLDQVQLLEDAFWQLYVGTMLPAASGDALDMIGALVGMPRDGRTDEAYRLWINAAIRLHQSNGRPPDLIAIARSVVPATVIVMLTETFPGALIVDLIGPIDVQTAASLGEMYREAKAAGVRIDTLASTVDPATTFILGDAALAPQIDANRGLSDLSQITGGALVGVF